MCKVGSQLLGGWERTEDLHNEWITSAELKGYNRTAEVIEDG
ncbi:MAG: hypothetical protein ACTS4X_02005 [Candidatus Hodgkinia cicadicola]